MTETASKDWHRKARALWRHGLSEQEIAERFSVTRGAVSYALRIVKLVEKPGRGYAMASGQANSRSRNTANASDELDCVSMMRALETGAHGSRSMLRRYSGHDE